jgi:DNA-binding response OmpR family regulator
VDVHINNLRKKIEANPSKPRFLVSVRGIGYRFESSDK